MPPAIVAPRATGTRIMDRRRTARVAAQVAGPQARGDAAAPQFAVDEGHADADGVRGAVAAQGDHHRTVIRLQECALLGAELRYVAGPRHVADLRLCNGF